MPKGILPSDMALIRRKRSVKKMDFLGSSDECYTLQGNTHKTLAQKFLSEVTSHQKQLFLFFGEKGMGKTRLAKETARELAKLVNEDPDDPLMFLFFINCERIGKEEGADVSDIKTEIAQKVAAVDETLSRALRQSNIDEFSTKLSTSLLKRVFLFLMDGFNPTSKNDVLSFLNDLVQRNENLLVMTTSCVHFSLTRLTPKVSTYTCTGLREDAAVALLREVAGEPKDLSEYEQDLVSHCYFNPLLIMIIGQEMNKETSSILHTAKDMHDLFQHSFSLAVQPGMVPEKDNVLGNVFRLVDTISQSIHKNLVTVIDQPSTSFTAEDVARDLKTPTAAVAKKSCLKELSKHSILSQEGGFFSVSDIFKNYFQEHRILLKQSGDEFVAYVYSQLQTTLRGCLSEGGMVNMLMIHREEMDKIVDMEKMIGKVQDPKNPLRYAYQVQLIMACEAFLSNIPISKSKICEFNEKVCTMLNRFHEQAFSAHEHQREEPHEEDMERQFQGLEITEGHVGQARSRQTRGGDKAAQKKLSSHFHHRVNKREADPVKPQKNDEKPQRTPQNEESLGCRFGLEIATSQMSRFEDFSSLTSSDERAKNQPPSDIVELPTVPVAVLCRPPPRQYMPPNQQWFHQSRPQEYSYHDNSSVTSNGDKTQPTEVSFHDWRLSSASENPEDWSVNVNVSTANSGEID